MPSPRHRVMVAPLIALTAVLGLAACTSGEDADDSTSTTTGGLEGEIPESGYWCRMISEDVVTAATDGRQDEAREVLRQNDDDAFRCEVVLPVDGGPETETVLAYEVQVDADEVAEEVRSRVAETDQAAIGPDFLGESYVVPGAAYAILPCGGPVGSDQEGQNVTYVLSLTGVSGASQSLSNELTDALRRTLIDLDQTVGCSPSEAADPKDTLGSPDGSGTTEAPAEDSATTTAP